MQPQLSLQPSGAHSWSAWGTCLGLEPRRWWCATGPFLWWRTLKLCCWFCGRKVGHTEGDFVCRCYILPVPAFVQICVGKVSSTECNQELMPVAVCSTLVANALKCFGYDERRGYFRSVFRFLTLPCWEMADVESRPLNVCRHKICSAIHSSVTVIGRYRAGGTFPLPGFSKYKLLVRLGVPIVP